MIMQQTTDTALYGQIRSNTEVVEAPFRYCLYARKSTEEDERQALSIDSQIKEMLQLAQKDNLIIDSEQFVILWVLIKTNNSLCIDYTCYIIHQ